MTDKEIEEARRAGEIEGTFKTEIDTLKRRVARMETGALALLTAAAYLWAKSAGLA